MLGITHLGADDVFSDVLQWSRQLSCGLETSPLAPTGFNVSLAQGMKNKVSDSDKEDCLWDNWLHLFYNLGSQRRDDARFKQICGTKRLDTKCGPEFDNRVMSSGEKNFFLCKWKNMNMV